MMKSPETADYNLEYFLLVSYGCLPNVIMHLGELRQQQKDAVIFCFSPSLYHFLHPLAIGYTWITIHYVDIASITTIRLRNPLNWWHARQRVNRMYEQWFTSLKDGAVVHFYNRHEALFLFYALTRLKDSHQLHYTECDPVDLYAWDYDSLRGWIQWAIFRLVYRAPFYMATLRGGKSERISVLSARFVKKVVGKVYARIGNLENVKRSQIYQTLSWHAEAKVLWIMGLLLDMNQVVPDEYIAVLEACRKVIDALYPGEEQAVKFHPRAQERESVWGERVQYIPHHIPAEFVDLPELKVIIVISSAAVAMFRSSLEIRVISLVDLLPFVSGDIHKKHQVAIHHFMPEDDFCLPGSLDDLRTCLSDI